MAKKIFSCIALALILSIVIMPVSESYGGLFGNLFRGKSKKSKSSVTSDGQKALDALREFTEDDNEDDNIEIQAASIDGENLYLLDSGPSSSVSYSGSSVSVIDANSQAQDFSPETYEKLDALFVQLDEDLRELGSQILKHNKPAFEAKLTTKERENDDEITAAVYSKVCAKGKTIVLGNAGADKKYYPVWIITGDENFPPPSDKARDSLDDYIGGLYVGADIAVLDAILGMQVEEASSIQNMNGALKVDDSGYKLAYISYNGDKITEFFYYSEEPVSRKAWTFAHNKAKKLGLSSFNF